MYVRISKQHRGKAWRAMIEVGPIHRIADDPIYEVSPAHVEMLQNRGFSFEVVEPKRPRKRSGR